MANRRFFVMGTDMGVGKTAVSVGLLRAFARLGVATAAVKPVSSGIVPGAAVNEDVLALQRAASVPCTVEQVGPVQLRAACAPHIAALLEGRVLERRAIVQTVHRFVVETPAEVVVAEGAGGFAVPLVAAPCPPEQARFGCDDVAADLGWPVILVIGLRRGCLNHAQLTHQALRAHRLKLAGWVGNALHGEMEHQAATLAALRETLGAPCLGVVPPLDRPQGDAVADHLDMALLQSLLRG